MNPRTPLCARLGIETPIFGFSHSIEEHQIEPLVYEAAGQSIAWFNELTTVRSIVERLNAETQAALANMDRLAG